MFLVSKLTFLIVAPYIVFPDPDKMVRLSALIEMGSAVGDCRFSKISATIAAPPRVTQDF